MSKYVMMNEDVNNMYFYTNRISSRAYCANNFYLTKLRYITISQTKFSFYTLY